MDPMATASLGELIRHRLPALGEIADSIFADILLSPTDSQPWTLSVHGRSAKVLEGAPRKPDTTVFADVDTLGGIIEGSVSGVEAFLDGRLRIRGNLALSLKLDSLFDNPARPKHFGAAKYVQAGKLRTFYLEAGEGAPVFLLHGLGATNASMLPTYWELAKTHRVIAPDNPGFGESDKPRTAYHPAFYARWLIDMMDALDIQQATFIGNSMGGRIALEMGMRHPERVDRLVLYAPSMAWKRFRQFVPIVKLLLPELAFVPLPVPRQRAMIGLKMMFADPSRLQQAWYEAAIDEFLRVFKSPRGRIGFFSAARQIYLEESHGPNGFWERLPELAAPALFIWGDRDILVPARFARHAADCLPHAKSVILPSNGHVPQFEHPALTHQLVREFLARTTY